MNFEPRYVEQNVNVPHHNHLGDFIRLSLWLLGIVFGIYLCLGFAAEKIAERLPPKYEMAIAGSFTSKLDDGTFPQTREYLQKVLDSLVASSADLPDFSYKVSIYDLSDSNAVALPAGNIVVFRGLLSQLKSENELAMILAHELGHYAHRDHLRGMGRGLVLLSIMTVLGLSGDGPGFIAPSVQTVSLKYSRDQESAADRYAIDLFARMYGHVGGALDVFKVLEREKKGISGPGFFSTHPDTLWRMQALERYIQMKKSSQGSVRPLPGAGVLPFKGDTRGNKGLSFK
ncbi:MAG: M48 family metallopeptidase [Nitrospirota bacterium]|nr:M48 family metallopeptidase [Nitrospirota bacterium]